MAIETNLGRLPSTNPNVGTVNSKIRTQQLLSGLEKLSSSLKSFGEFNKERQTQNDIITARTAFAVNKELPGNLRPEAELAYNSLVAKKETQQFFRLLHDDAAVFGNGLLVDDDNYPDHTAKQAAYSDFIDGSIQTFYGQAQFDPAQQDSILDFVDLQRNNLKGAYTLLNAKDIKAQKLNDSAQYVQESIFSNIATFKFLKKFDPENAGLQLNQQFTDQWHMDLQQQLLEANPHLTLDEADILIIQQLEMLAIDPDNPQPELMDYLSKKRSGGQPRFSSMQSLQSKIKAAQIAARKAFITNSKAIDTREAKIQKENEKLDEDGASLEVLKILKNPAGERNLAKLKGLLKVQFPNIKDSALRSIVSEAHTFMTSSGIDGNPGVTARLKREASKGSLNHLAFEGDPRHSMISNQERTEVYQEIFNFSQGKKQRGRILVNEGVDDFERSLRAALMGGAIITINDKPFKLSNFKDITFDPLGRMVGFKPEAERLINELVDQYEVAADGLFTDDDPEKNIELNTKLKDLKNNLLIELGILSGKQKQLKPDSEFTRQFNTQVEEDIKAGETPEGIRDMQTAVEQSYIPEIHVPVPTATIQEKITKSTQVNQSFIQKLIDDQISKAGDLQTAILGEPEPTGIVEQDVFEPVPTVETKTIPQQRTEAHERAFPEVPNERNTLRALQDDAKFQSDRTIIDAISDFFNPKEAGAASFIADQEGFILEATDIGDGKITSGLGLTDTGRKIGDKVTKKQAVKELKERLDRVERPALKKIEKVLSFDLSENQKTVLLSLMFNIGVSAFRTSDAMKNLKAGDMEGFKREAFSKEEGWVEIKGTFSQGLFNRRQRELQLWDE